MLAACEGTKYLFRSLPRLPSHQVGTVQHGTSVISCSVCETILHSKPSKAHNSVLAQGVARTASRFR